MILYIKIRLPVRLTHDPFNVCVASQCMRLISAFLTGHVNMFLFHDSDADMPTFEGDDYYVRLSVNILKDIKHPYITVRATEMH